MSAVIHQWLTEPPDPEARKLIKRWSQTEVVEKLAFMRAVHPAEGFCVGAVLGTNGWIYPQAVGGDIGCGIATRKFNGLRASVLSLEVLQRIQERIAVKIPIHRKNRAITGDLPAELTRQPLCDPHLENQKNNDAVLQIGTLGTGNHFLELQLDEDGALWAMVHSGSRGIGQRIFGWHLAHALRMKGGVLGLDSDTDAGKMYLADMEWARKYAAANRWEMLEATAKIMKEFLGVVDEVQSYIDCDHNHLKHEHHGDGQLWIHRKGANSAWVGEAGLIPGSMGTRSFHVTGRGHPDSLFSSSHGAGRSMSRAEASVRISTGDFLKSMKGILFDVQRARRLKEEAPGAYKDIHKVMRAQNELVRITRRLEPILNYKG